MNKRMILLTALICASPVMNMIASQKSVAAMYNDFKKSVIDSDNQSLDSKLSKLHEVRSELIDRREVMDNEVMKRSDPKLNHYGGLGDAVMYGMLGWIYGVLSCDLMYNIYSSKIYDADSGRYVYSYRSKRLKQSEYTTKWCYSPFRSPATFGLLLSAALFGASYITYQNYQDRKICGKKIIEIDAIIVRLDTFKAQLEDELEKKYTVAA
jgi:hypothetical protein